MTVYLYHGKGRGVKPQQLARYSCVLTTYTSMGMEAAPRGDAKNGTNAGQPIELEVDGDEEDSTTAGVALHLQFLVLYGVQNQGVAYLIPDTCLLLARTGSNYSNLSS